MKRGDDEMLSKEEVIRESIRLYSTVAGNVIPDTEENVPECRGVRMFDEPLIGFGSADDALFAKYKEPGIIGPWFRTPGEWLSGAKTVISFFFPISPEIRRANAEMTEHTSIQWAYARVDGQEYLNSFISALSEYLTASGSQAVVPTLAEGFFQIHRGNIEGYDCVRPDTFGSSWSERHAAYVCGLGTFSLTRGLITKRGVAGRFISLVTDCPIEPDVRDYTGIYDYCTMCGACVKRCPEGAIDLKTGKDQMKCSVYSAKSRALFAPRFGCGLCQTKVPCEHGIPLRPERAQSGQ